jgi:hypothetical protein
MSTATQAKAPRTRRDPSGEFTATLTTLLESGARLDEQARLIESAVSLASFRRVHRAWVLACLSALTAGFEPESVSEFVHANPAIPTDEELTSAARAAVRVMRDALEMLRGLRATLDYESSG